MSGITDLTVDVAPHAVRARRHITFRIFAAAVAVLLVVGFGVWLSILTPWVDLGDDADHGWTRTPELHRLADSASAALMAAIAAAAVVLVIRPHRRSAVTAWLVAMLAAMGISSFVSSAIQGQDPGGAAIFVVVWFALAVAPLVLFAPDRRSLAAGGVAAASGPGRNLVIAFTALASLGVLLAAAAIVWRIAGGIIEDPREDDLLGFVLLGLALALGALQCLRGREGWRALGVILAVLTAYGIVAVVSIALG